MGFLKKALDILPTALASRAFGAIADIEFTPKIQKAVNSAFARAARLNMKETGRRPEDYPSLNKLFTRALLPGQRTIDDAHLVSPVDGTLSFMGCVTDGVFLEAKGQLYSASQLAATESPELADWMNDAYAFTIYLSPRNYHRIHAPASGAITDISYAPGRLLPVNRIGYFLTDDLLPANERLTSFIRLDNGHRCALVKVGATCVGRISLTFDDFTTNHPSQRTPFVKKLDTDVTVRAGDEIACFELGSTVVLLADRQNFVPSPNLIPGQKITVGTCLGNWLS